jgi:nucleotide-binding universal stress UspA family protein
MFQRIIVPLDGSRRAERAIPIAAHLARIARGSIVFLRVVAGSEMGFYGMGPAVEVVPTMLETKSAEADAYLLSIMTTFRDDLTGIKTETAVETGATASTIVSAARWEHGDLIVLCSHGETGLKRWVFNSIAVQAARYSPVPVLILNEHNEAHPLEDVARTLHVLVPLDGSELAESALTPALQLMATRLSTGKGVLHLLRVIDVPLLNGSMRDLARVDALARQHAHAEAQMYLDAVVKRLQAANQDNTPLDITTSVILSPDRAGAIIQRAEAEGCDLIALATHGRGALMHVLMGSVTESVIGHTILPLLVTRPPKPPVEQKETDNRMNDEQKLSSWVGLL